MVFRKESRADSFQRQISALRQQLSADQEGDEFYDDAEPMPGTGSGPISPVFGQQGAGYATPTPMTPAVPVIPVATGNVGVIAANSSWSGTLRTPSSIHVFGTVDGELRADDEVYIAEGAVVDAFIAAVTVIVAGSMTGTVECTGRLEVLPSGHVSGDVTTPTLIVHEGATVEGDLKMRAPEPDGSSS